MPRSDLRWSWLAIVLPVAIAGCSLEEVSLDSPPGPPPKGISGACTATARTLASLPGALARPGLGIVQTNLVAVTTAGADGSGVQTIWWIPKDGSTPQRFATSETPIAQFAVSEDNSVFWTTAGAGGVDGGATGAVWAYAPMVTNEPTVLVSGRRSPGALVVSEPKVFWAEQDVDPSGSPIETVVEMPTDGGPVTRVQTLAADDVPHGLLALYVPSTGLGFTDTESLFWTTADPELGNQRTAEISERPLTVPFGPLTRIAGPDAGGAGAIAQDFSCTGIIFGSARGIDDVTESMDGQLSAPRPFADAGGFVDHVRTDGVEVYFIDPATERLVAVPRVPDAGAPRTVASRLDPASPFEVDTACVYWLDADAGVIEMIKK